MATYIQGVTDYIPEYQPFQPDLNFYANYLEKKQNVYDSNYKAVNNLYGQYYYADLTRPGNIKKKDQLLKNIDFNLNRVAGLDLSLEQNVQQATQIFTPFYEDKSLMKDMAYTKDFGNKYNSALSLQKSKDPKTRGQYWGDGVKYMLYEREKFKNSTDDESLGFANAEWVPYKNPVETYNKLATDMGISADITQSNGRYFVRKKNGDLILQDLTNIFTSAFANDPELQKIAQVQAVVNREDKIRENASKFNGDLVASERDYLTTQYNVIQEYIKLKNVNNQENLKSIENQQKEVNTKIENGDVNQYTPEYVRALEESYGIAKDNTQYTDALSSDINDKASRSTTTSSGQPDLSDIESLRYKVDAGVASMFAEQDIAEAAYGYSRRNMVVDISADPYGVSAQNHAYALSRQRESQRHKEILLEAQDKKNKENIVLDAGLKNGTFIGINNETGEGIPNPALFNRRVFPGKNESAGTSEKTDILIENREMLKDVTNEYASPMIKSIINTINVWSRPDGRLNKAQVKKMFFDNKMSADEFYEKFQKNPTAYLSGKGADFLQRLYENVTSFAIQTRGDSGMSESYLMNASHDKFDTYLTYLKYNKLIKKENAKVLDKNLSSSLVFEGMDLTPQEKQKFIESVYDKNSLMLLSKDKFIALNKNTKIKGSMSYPFKVSDTPPSGLPTIKEMSEKEYSSWKSQVLKLDKELFKLDPNGKWTNDGRAQYELRMSQSPENAKWIKQKYNRVEEIKNQLKSLGAYGQADPLTIRIKDKKDKNGNQVLVQHRTELLWDNANRDKDDVLSSIYDDLSKNFVGTAKNSRELKSVYNNMGQKGTGLANTNYSGLDVSLSAVGTPGFEAFMDFVQKDMPKINLYDDKNPVSFYGASISGVKDTQKLFDNDKDDAAKVAEFIIDYYYKNVGKKDIKNFSLFSAQIAMEDKNKGAMIIKPDNSVLKDIIETDTQGLITKDVQQAILKNGIAIISNKRNFENSIFTGNEITPLEGLVNALGEITYEDPMGGGSITIQNNKTGSSDYNVYGTVYGPKINGKRTSTPFELPTLMYQNNIDALWQLGKSKLREAAYYNNQVFREFQNQNDK
jgi:hypothetical protein